jgi:hypothetical protein
MMVVEPDSCCALDEALRMKKWWPFAVVMPVVHSMIIPLVLLVNRCATSEIRPVLVMVIVVWWMNVPFPAGVGTCAFIIVIVIVIVVIIISVFFLQISGYGWSGFTLRVIDLSKEAWTWLLFDKAKGQVDEYFY